MINCNPTDSKYQNYFSVDELGSDNLRNSNQIAITGWWFISERQLDQSQFFFYLSTDITSQTVLADGSIGGTEVSDSRRELALWVNTATGENRISFYTQKYNDLLDRSDFLANIMGQWSFVFFSINHKDFVGKAKISSENTPYLPTITKTFTSGRSSFSQMPNMGLWLYAQPGYCKMDGYMKDIFFHIGYHLDSEPNSFEIMKRGEISYIAQFPLVFYEDENPTALQILRDSTNNTPGLIRGNNELAALNDPIMFKVTSFNWELRFFKGQYLQLSTLQLSSEFTIKFGINSIRKSSANIFTALWESEGLTNTLYPLIIKNIFYSNNNTESIQVCLKGQCFQSTDLQNSGTSYYVYVSFMEIAGVGTTNITIQINDNQKQLTNIPRTIAQDFYSKIIIGDFLGINNNETGYFRLFDFTILTGSFIKSGSEVSLNNCRVQFGKNTNTLSCAQCASGYFRNQQGKCLKYQNQCPKIYNSMNLITSENLCRFDCPQGQQKTFACNEEYLIEKQYVQQGSIEYTSPTSIWETNIQITFDQLMISTPKIYLVIEYLNSNTAGVYHLEHQTHSISTQGFTLHVILDGLIIINKCRIRWTAVSEDIFEVGSLRIVSDSDLSLGQDKLKKFQIKFNSFKQYIPTVLISVISFQIGGNSAKIIAFQSKITQINQVFFEIEVKSFSQAPLLLIEINWIATLNYSDSLVQQYDFDQTNVQNFFNYLGTSDRNINLQLPYSYMPTSFIQLSGITSIRKLSTQNDLRIEITVDYVEQINKMNVQIKQELSSSISALGINAALVYYKCFMETCREFSTNKKFQTGIDKSMSINSKTLDYNNNQILNYTTPTIAFQEPFTNIPKLILSINKLEIVNTGNVGAKFLMKTGTITTSGFTINYSKFGFTYIDKIWASWLAFADIEEKYMESGQFTVTGINNYVSKTVTFLTPKNFIPNITYSIVGLDVVGSNLVHIETISINKTQFIANISTNYGKTVNGVWINWLALIEGQFKKDQIKIYSSGDPFSQTSGQSSNSDRWDNLSFAGISRGQNSSNSPIFFSIMDLTIGSVPWKMDFSNIDRYSQLGQLSLSVHLQLGFTQSIGFNFIDIELPCLVNNCNQCHPNNQFECINCKGSLRVQPYCSCPQGFYEDQISQDCTPIPNKQCAQFDPLTKKCLACHDSINQNIDQDCQCSSFQFRIYQQQGNQAFDWNITTFNNNNIQFNMTYCDKCIIQYLSNGSQILIKNFYNPIRSIDTRYNYFSQEIFNSTSSFTFLAQQNHDRLKATASGLIPNSFLDLLSPTQVNYDASYKSLCVFNNDYSWIEYLPFGEHLQNNLWNGEKTDIMKFVLTPNSFKALYINERLLYGKYFSNYFTMNENIKTLYNDEYSDQCQEILSFPLTFSKHLKNGLSRTFIGTGELRGNDASNKFDFEKLGGKNILSKSSEFSISSWLFLKKTGTKLTDYCVTPFILTTQGLQIKEYFIYCGWKSNFWRVDHKYPQYYDNLQVDSPTLPANQYLDNWFWIIISFEINQDGLGAFATIKIISAISEQWISFTSYLRNAIYSLDNPNLALYVNGYSQFYGESWQNQVWNGLIYDLSWHVGISARTMKQTTLKLMMSAGTELLYQFNYLDSATLYGGYIREIGGYKAPQLQQLLSSPFTFYKSPSISFKNQYFQYNPAAFEQEYSINYDIFIQYQEPFEFMTFQRIDQSDNSNIFSIYHIYDPLKKGFQTKICQRYICQTTSSNSFLKTNQWQNVFIAIRQKIGEFFVNEPTSKQIYEKDTVTIESEQGREKLNFMHYEPESYQQDPIIILAGPLASFGITNQNIVKIKYFRIDQGGFSMGKYENINKVIPHCLAFVGKEYQYCRICELGYIKHPFLGNCIAANDSQEGCGGVNQNTIDNIFMKLPQNYYYNLTYDSCHPCSPNCEICLGNISGQSYPNNCLFCQAPYTNPPICNKECGINTITKKQLFYLKLNNLNIECVEDCPESFCRDNERKICRKCSDQLYTRDQDENQYFTSQFVQDKWIIIENGTLFNQSILTSICSTSYLENQVLNIIGGKGIFSRHIKMKRTYSQLPAHYMIKIKVIAFFVDFDQILSSSQNLIIQMDNTLMESQVETQKSLDLYELCGEDSKKDILRSYVFSANHNYKEMIIQIESQIDNWGVRNIEIYLGFCHETCLTCFGSASTQCLSCSCGLQQVGNECTCLNKNQYAAKLNDCQETSVCFQCKACHEACSACDGPSYNDCFDCALGFVNKNGSCLPFYSQEQPCSNNDQQYDSILNGCFQYNFTIAYDLFDQPINRSQLSLYTTEYGSQLIDVFNCAEFQYMGIWTSYPRYLKRQFSLDYPHSFCQLQLVSILLDSWDNENFNVEVDNNLLYQKTLYYKSGLKNICLVSDYKDTILIISQNFSHTSNTLNLNIYSDLDEGPYYKYNDEGWAVRNISLSCSSCHYTCMECNQPGSRNNCTGCYDLNVFILVEGQCICKDGFFLTYSNPCLKHPCVQCIKCSPSCEKCTGKGPFNCINCQQGFILSENGLCIACPSDTYFNKDSCKPCHSTCLTCQGSKFNDCKSCPPSLLLHKKQCLEKCPIGFYADQTLRKCTSNSYTLQYQFFDKQLFTNDEVNQANIISFASANNFQNIQLINKVSICNGISLLGGEQILGKDHILNISLAQISPHDGIAINLEFYTIGNWESQDLLLITLNNQTILFNRSFSEFNSSYQAEGSIPFFCNSNNLGNIVSKFNIIFNYSDIIQVYKDYFILIQVQTSNKPLHQFSYGIRNIIARTFRCHPFCATCFDQLANSCLSCPLFSTLDPQSHTCVCQPQYYLQSISNCFFAPCSYCARCLKPCGNCFSNNDQSCLSCDCGLFYLNISSQGYCQSTCPPYLYIQNAISHVCQECQHPCASCQSNISNCTTCVQGFLFQEQGNICELVCSQGFFPDLRANQCRMCDLSCQGCTGLGSFNCINCIDGFFNKSFPNGTFSCQPCDSRCTKCTGPQNTQCIQCQIDIIFQNQTCTQNCLEFYGTFPDFNSLICQSCNSICKTCTGSSELQCEECIDGYFLNSTTHVCTQCHEFCLTCSGSNWNQCFSCKPGYYLRPTMMCIQCPITCKTCINQNNCTSCLGNRQSIACDCQMPFGINYWPQTITCGDCEIAIVEIHFSQDWLSIQINFDYKIELVENNNNLFHNQYLHQICELIFDNETLNLLGSGSKCGIKWPIQKSIIVELDNTSQILPGVYLNLKANQIKRSECNIDKNITLLLFNQVYESILSPQNLQVSLKGPAQILSNCQSVIIEIDQISGDGMRGVKNLTWKIMSIIPQNQASEVDLAVVLNQANLLQSRNLTFPPLFFSENSKYIFQLEAFSYFEYFTVSYFTLTLGDSHKIKIETVPAGKLIFSRQDNISILVIFQHLQCISETEDILIQDEINYTIVQKEGIPDVNLINNFSVQAPAINHTYFLNISAFTVNSLQNYSFQFTAQLKNKPQISNQIDIKFQISQKPLNAYIVGGSRITSFTEQLILEGQAYDADIDPLDPDPFQGMSFSWYCLDISVQEPCRDQLGNLINLQPNRAIIIPKKTLIPYKSYKFLFTVYKDSRSKSQECVIMVQEFNLPQLALDIPPALSEGRINLNSEIFLTINYSNLYSVDTLFYSATLLYNYESVSTIIFQYVKVRFKIWDYYTNFSSGEDLMIRFSVYNPLFLMPSQMSLQIKINMPPSNCKLKIQPSSDYKSLSTNFSIIVDDCQDNNQPLLYQFVIYQSQNDQIKETLNPLTTLHNIITQPNVNQNSIITMLNQGFSDNAHEIILTAIITDSIGGIANISQALKILPSYSSQNDMNNYLLTLQTLFNEAISFNDSTNLDNEMRLLTILTLDINNQDIVLPNNSNIIDLKKKILEQFNLIQNSDSLQLPTANKWQQQISRLTSILMKNASLFLSSMKNDQINNMISSLDSIVAQSEDQLESLPFEGYRNETQSQQAQKMDAMLMNCLEIVDGILKGINSDLVVNQSNSNKSKIINAKIINITQLIANLLLFNSLPNEPAKTFKGEALQIKAARITPKQLSIYLQYSTKDWSQLNQDESTIDTKNKIYYVSFKNYKINPFATDSNFPQNRSIFYNKTFNVIDPQIRDKIDATSNINISSPIRHSFYVPPQTIDNSSKNNNSGIRRNLDSEQNVKPITYCISQLQDKSWQKEICTKVEENLDNGGTSVKCICQTLSLASINIVDDFTNIFTNNKNIDNILSNEGMQIISEMEWWNYAIFYLGTFFTASWLYLIYYGYQLDLNSSKIHNNQQNLNIKINDKVDNLENDNIKELRKDQEQQIEQSNNLLLPIKQQIQSNNKSPITQDSQYSLIVINQQQHIPQQMDYSPYSNFSQQNEKLFKNQTNIVQDLSKDVKQDNKQQFIVINQINQDNVNIINNECKQKILDQDQDQNQNIAILFERQLQVFEPLENLINDEKVSNNNIILEKTENIIVQANKLQNDNENYQIFNGIEKEIPETLRSMNNDQKENAVENQNQENQNIDNMILIEQQQNEEQKQQIANLKSNINQALEDQNQQNQQSANQISSQTIQQQLESNVIIPQTNFQLNQYQNKITDEQENNQQQQHINLPENSNKNKSQQIKKNSIEQSKIKLLVIGITSYHQFLSIFTYQDPILSRPVRFTIFYVKITFFMATTAIFSTFLNFIQTIFLSATLGITFSIITSIISQLLKKNIFIKLTGILILLGIIGFCWYSSLVVAGTRGYSESNLWALEFFLTFIIDNFIIQVLQGTAKYFVLLFLIKNQPILTGLMQTIVSFLIKTITNDKIKEIFNNL